MMRAGSLCSGYGGLDLAVHSVLGGELAWVADTDPGAAAILAYRFPSVPNLDDITAVDWCLTEPVDVLTAGFPCQDVSCAGARKGLRAGTRTGVWSHVAEAIGALRPSLVLLENVRGLLSAGADSDMEPCPWCLGETGDEHALRAAGAVLGDLASLGFDAEWEVVSAARGGAPHRRERVFILAWPAADSCGGELQRRGVGGVLAGEERAAAGAGDQRERDGDAAGDRGAAAADAERDGLPGRDSRGPGDPDAPGAGSRAEAAGSCPGAPADALRGGRDRRPRDAQRKPQGRAAARRDSDAAPDPDGTPGGRHEPGSGPRPLQGAAVAERAAQQPRRLHSGSRGEVAVAWGAYGPAIARWEAVTGRRAPRPTEPGRTGERLSPRFVEWMQGLPEGWVTDVPGLSRNAMLKALGNGVVPQQAALALRLLLDRAGAVAEAGEAA